MRMSTGRRLVVAAAALALGGAALAAPGPAAAAERTESFTVLLSPSDRAGFDALLTIRGLALHDRASFLSQVAPTATAQRTVEQRLASLGLSIDRSSRWSVRASGPASVVDALLGDRAARRRAETAAYRAGRPLPRTSSVPSLLSGLASAVTGGNDTAPVAHPLSAQTGASLRALYHATVGTPTGSNPALTVATLQLSGWNSADLTSYANLRSLPDPVASGQYVGISSGGGDPALPDSNHGAVEVALDQESLLEVAPKVKQRAYFAPNTTDGFVSAIDDVAQDAVANHIAALSISWGDCEAHWGSDMLAVDQALQLAVASGVTVFAASGDNGSTDCVALDNSTSIGVDFPASDPLVVGVGGTTVTSSTTESAWTYSGGGVSLLWPHPDWQNGSARRKVPDISADADPASGVVIYSSDSGCLPHGLPTHQCQVGGTSLASPLAAGTFAATLAAHGFDGGVGDIHDALYSAPAGDFRDITSGTNGFPATVGYDLVTGLGSPIWDHLYAQLGTPLAASVSQAAPLWSNSLNVPIVVAPTPAASYVGWAAGPGGTAVSCAAVPTTATLPSTVTVAGEGTSWIWVEGRTASGHCDVARTIVRVDTTAPTVTARIGLTVPTSSGVTASWKGVDAGALDHYRAVISHVGSSTPDLTTTTTRPSVAFSGKQGLTYVVSVTAFDKARNVSRVSTAKAAVPIDDRGFVLRSWKRTRASASYLGSYSLASSSKASAVRIASGRAYSLQFTTCPTCGRVKVYVGRTLVRTLDLYSARTHYRTTFALATYPTVASRVITVRPAGTKSRASHGVQVRFDALVAFS